MAINIVINVFNDQYNNHCRAGRFFICVLRSSRAGLFFDDVGVAIWSRINARICTLRSDSTVFEYHQYSQCVPQPIMIITAKSVRKS